jgi:hypothetical protein
MKYTLWLNGHLLGETRLQHRNPAGNQRLGALRPTPYGLELLPGLCGFLQAAAAVKKSLTEMGIDDPDTEADRTMELLESTPEGTRFTDLVKTLGKLELREAGGGRAPFHTVILTDIHELDALTRSLDTGATLDAERELAAGAPRFLVSATRSEPSAMGLTRTGNARLSVRLEPN